MRPTTAILALVQLAVAIAWPERVRAQEPESVRLSGYVRSAANEEVLRSARLEIVEREFSIATNRFGYYSIELVPGRYSIRVSTLGYETAIGPER
ncbi:carboxypeptidase regulatory-like domain-containing protein [Candidatus Palauibacter sp.]|uniref:carboxypeptidase regulatory-like domain-containing protein n=1 Tax=Candidatus Palauibacter sp. TaxID=3101350 RepID=UPI003AF2B27D